MRIALLVSIVLTPCAAALAQVAPEARTAADRPGPQTAAASRPASDLRAIEMFKRAAGEQTGGGAPLVIRDFQADLEVTIHETDQKTKERTRKSGSVTEFYRARGADKPLFRRRLDEKIGGSRTEQGYDGGVYWQKLGNAPAQDLSRGRDSKEDRERIKDEMARTTDFLRFLFLANLEGGDVTLRLGQPLKIKANGRERAVETVIRECPREGPIELYFGEADGKPVLYGFSRKTASGATELITFSIHRLVKTGDATALVPLVAEYRENGVLTFEARVAREADIKFNTSIPDAVFGMAR